MRRISVHEVAVADIENIENADVEPFPEEGGYDWLRFSERDRRRRSRAATSVSGAL
jgi:hypothetical protein